MGLQDVYRTVMEYVEGLDHLTEIEEQGGLLKASPEDSHANYLLDHGFCNFGKTIAPDGSAQHLMYTRRGLRLKNLLNLSQGIPHIEDLSEPYR